MSIFIKLLSGKTIRLEIDPWDSIISLKEKIYEAEDILPHQQKLVFNGKNLEDERNLQYYGINEGAVDLVERDDVAVAIKLPSGSQVNFYCKPGDVISSLKMKLFHEQNIPIKHQNLYYNRKELQDEKKLEFYNIRQDCVLNLAILNEKNLKKILKRLYEWDEGLVLPMNTSLLENNWNGKARKLMESAGLCFSKESKVYFILKSSTFHLLWQANIEKIQENIINQNKITAGQLENSAEFGNEKNTEGVYQFIEKFTEKSHRTLKKYIEEFIPNLNEDLMLEIDYKSIEKDLDNRIVKKAKEIHPDLFSNIKDNFKIQPHEEKKVEAEKKSAHPKPIKRFYKKLRSAPPKPKPIQLTSSERIRYLEGYLSSLESKSISLFDDTIIKEDSRIFVGKLIAQTCTSEIPTEIYMKILELLNLPDQILQKLLIYDASFILEYTDQDCLSQEPDFLFIILCILLVFSNTYADLAQTEKKSDHKYSSIYRQWIREIIRLYEKRLKTDSKWQFLLEAEQVISKSLISKEKEDWVFYPASVDFKDVFEAAVENKKKLQADLPESVEQTSEVIIKKGIAEESLDQYKTLEHDKYALDRIINKPSLSITIAIPGWLSDDRDGEKYHWPFLVERPEQPISYSLVWDASNLLEATVDMFSWGGKFGKSLLTSFQASKSIYEDNPFALSAQQAEATGIMLAHLICEGLFKNMTISLIGYSLGGRIIHYCLMELLKIDPNCDRIHDIYLLAAATPNDKESFEKIKPLVKGRFVNAYSHKDMTLGVAYTLATFQNPVGLGVLEVEGVENIDVTKVSPHHLDYRNSLDKVLEAIKYNL
ncbi:unnamed protein product [Blepharisma stoltei]|uniref:Ubiquitin-like domain-containing protein n=1 Tax=Blepharisma stoltei TaxID=1481888 RepID=A0AAU9IRC8_9CILI|nr:unnamed protein product [Blepharisma stoltei]